MIETIHGWIDQGRNPEGELVQGQDGYFYGTTSSGGANGNGTVFRINAAGEYTLLHSFAGTDGRGPRAGLVLGRDGYFYGSTSSGGAHNYGTIFRISAAGEHAVLHSFTHIDGSYPVERLVQGRDNSFYGVASNGGASGDGVIFRISAAGEYTLLHSFAGMDGRRPEAGLVQGDDGFFYGTTSSGGATGNGTIFRINAAGEYFVLRALADTDGLNPRAGLVLGRDGYFYGTTTAGGSSNRGAIFRISTAGEYTVIRSLTDFTGGAPEAALVQGSDGFLYGTTSIGGTDNFGTIFRISATGVYSKLYSFVYTPGSTSKNYYHSGLVQGHDGCLYGTSSVDGPNGRGTIFRISTSGEYTLLKSLSDNPGGSNPAALVQGGDGYFYGVTSSGGASGYGTIFRSSATGEHTVLRSFSGADGSFPAHGLVPGRDGFFYGVTSRGGANGNGTIFRISSAGEYTILRSFSGADGRPSYDLAQGNDGYFYGTSSGGYYGNIIFRISTAGEYTVLRALINGDVTNPDSALLQGSDGFLYGKTSAGGAIGYGTIFRMSTKGEYSVLYSFQSPSSASSDAGLLQGSDGAFYGATSYGGTDNRGSIFRVSAAGEYTLLHSFEGTSYNYPHGGLVEDRNGYFYGATSNGGTHGYGTIFRVNAAGEYRVLHSFEGADGKFPTAPVIGSDGNLWGATNEDDSYGAGVIYRLLLEPGTLPPDRVTYSSANLRAWVSRDNGTMVQFEYSTDPTLSASALTDLHLLPDGTDAETVSDVISNLQPGTIYYYRPCIRRRDGLVQRGDIRSFTTGLAEPQIAVLARKGAAVPGAGTPSSGIPEGATWRLFGVPALGSHSQTAFNATLKLSTGVSLTGIFAGDPSTPVLVAIRGDTAPGISAGTVFSFFNDPVINGEGKVAFIGHASGGWIRGKARQGIWSNAGVLSGRPEWFVALEGFHAVGVPFGAVWKAFTSVALSDSGVISFTATLEQGRGGVTAANDSGLWQASTSGTSLLLREGQEVVLDGVTRRVKSFVALSSGQGRFRADGKLPVRVTFSDKSQAILQLGTGAEPEVLAATGDAVAGTGGALFRSFGEPAVNQAGTAVFSATLLRGIADVKATNESGIFMMREDNWDVIARKGGIAPGVTWKGAPGTFVSFGDPLINGEGQVAFVGTTTGGAKGLWWSSGAGGDLQLVASTSTAVPGVDAARYAAFKSVALPDGELAGPVFVAKLDGKGITPANDVGLWAVDTEGVLRLIVREGDMVDGKVLRSFTFLSTVPGSSAQPRSYDAQRQLIYRAFFTDGSQSLVTVRLP